MAPKAIGIAGGAMMDALDAFFQEHSHCGVVDGGMEDGHAWLLCWRCGATYGERWRITKYLERWFLIPSRSAVNFSQQEER